MGPNGGGKSTLAHVLAGDPVYAVTKGTVQFDEANLLKLLPSERSHLGILLLFQYPLEIAGLNVASFLRLIYNKRFDSSVSPIKFRALLAEKMKLVNMKPEFMERGLNEGFSGGEKKKMEVLQMLVMEPRLAILDEIDSGLDVDAVKSTFAAVAYLRRKNLQSAFIIITHYAKAAELVKPDFVHIMRGGRIVRSGGSEMIGSLEQSGFKDA